MEKLKTEITTTASTINDVLDQKTSGTTNEPVSKDTGAQFDINFVDEELHKQLKNEVGDMYSTWDEADQRFVICSNIFLISIYFVAYPPLSTLRFNSNKNVNCIFISYPNSKRFECENMFRRTQ